MNWTKVAEFILSAVVIVGLVVLIAYAAGREVKKEAERDPHEDGGIG